MGAQGEGITFLSAAATGKLPPFKGITPTHALVSDLIKCSSHEKQTSKQEGTCWKEAQCRGGGDSNGGCDPNILIHNELMNKYTQF